MMTKPQGAKSEILHSLKMAPAKLARRENRTIADIIERALETYEAREAGREPAAKFYSRLSSQSGTDIDFDSIIDENRRTHKGVEL